MEFAYEKVKERLNNDAPAEKKIENNGLETLKELLNNEQGEVVRLSIERIGDLCRMEENRSVVGQSGVIELMSQQLLNEKKSKEEKDELLQWIARAFANLSFDHDENRKRISELNMLPLLISGLEAKNNDNLVRNCSGCIANLSSQTEAIQQKVRELGGIEKLVSVLSNQNDMVLGLTLRAICNLSDDVENRKEVWKSEGLEKIINILKVNENENVLSECITTLSALSTDDFLCIKMIEHKIVDVIIEKISSEDKDLVERNKSIVQLLVSFSEKDFVADHFLKLGVLDLFVEKMRDEHLFVEIKEQFSKCVSLMALNDKCVEKLYESIDFFIKNTKKDVNEEGIRVASLMVVGNCARKDENCKDLIEKYEILNFLKDLVLEEGASQIQHLAIGALNNLSIPLDNRKTIVKSGYLAYLLQVIQQKEKRNAHVLFGAVITLKRICSHEKDAEFRKQFVFEEKGVEILMTIKEGLAMSEHARIWFEVGRFLSILIRSDEDIMLSVLKHEDSVDCLFSLVEAEWSVLNTEGFAALVKICKSSDNNEVGKLINKEEYIDKVISKLNDPKDPNVELQGVMFLESLVVHPHFHQYLPKIKSAFQQMISQIKLKYTETEIQPHLTAIAYSQKLLDSDLFKNVN
eukprot:TRINITY_DN1001_c0_g1_i1.p1 TRINITY_DN1001_c0_g1~~TRINITY_DN1001_c0_g1_i1.p1  ORF type:complete len:635 (-),score=219.58 TRINITY_DN1001_c0_g1_i1:74-1978(-)